MGIFVHCLSVCLLRECVSVCVCVCIQRGRGVKGGGVLRHGLMHGSSQGGNDAFLRWRACQIRRQTFSHALDTAILTVHSHAVKQDDCAAAQHCSGSSPPLQHNYNLPATQHNTVQHSTAQHNTTHPSPEGPHLLSLHTCRRDLETLISWRHWQENKPVSTHTLVGWRILWIMYPPRSAVSRQTSHKLGLHVRMT